MQLNTMKCFRLLYHRGLLPLVTAMDVVPHLTGTVSISAGGAVVKPIVILKNLQNLGELIDLEPHCFFAASVNGSRRIYRFTVLWFPRPR
jgi:hypothetical protein